MVSVLSSNVINRVFYPKPTNTKLVVAAYRLNMHYYGVKINTCWLGIRIMCASEATSLSPECCFSEQAL